MALAETARTEMTLAEMVRTGMHLDLAEPALPTSGDQAPRQPRSAPARVAAADATLEAALQLDLTARAVVR